MVYAQRQTELGDEMRMRIFTESNLNSEHRADAEVERPSESNIKGGLGG